MAIGGVAVRLDPAHDTLINVNALGDSVPLARFMGGREYEMMMEGASVSGGAGDIDAVVKSGATLLPSVETHSGPFQGLCHRWTVEKGALTDAQRHAAVSCYLALMSAVSLNMIGTKGPVFVEGPFAGNEIYCSMLATAT